ncbi:MAG: hypothetical protein AAGL23_14325, partial [Pseudomonadota bacterium]
MTDTVVVSEDSGVWIGLDGWYIHNNTWNRRDLTNGTDYDQSITVPDVTYPEDATVDGAVLAWDWPEEVNDAFVYGYPELAIGQVPWNPLQNTFDHFPIQVQDIVDLSLDFDFDWQSLDPEDDFNISVSLWLTNDPDGGFDAVQNEVMIWLRNSSHNPAGEFTGVEATDNLGTYELWLLEDQTDASGQNDHVWDFIVPTYWTDSITAGTLDIDDILQVMQDNGLIASDLWLHSVEIGAEIVQGDGSLTINDVDLHLEEVEGLGEAMAGDGAGNAINGRHGDDTITGLAGDDSLIGMSGDDSILGGAGRDTLRGGWGDDTLDAGTDDHRDLIDPGRGNNVVVMSGTNGAWDNLFFTDIGHTTVIGTGTGDALVGHHMSFTDQRTGIALDLSTGLASSSLLSVDFSAARVFNVIAGSGFDDTFTGGNAAFDHWEQFTGYGGDDHFDGGSGVDAVSFVDEELYGFWDVANNRHYIGTVGANVNLATGTGTDTFGDTDTFAHIEALLGSSFGDRFVGGAEDNFLVGHNGNDTLVGGAGGDSFLGGRDSDSIVGGLGTDTINFLSEVTQLGGTQ